ncbi:carboxypeptidase B-like [Patiria miniata]|uniref:Peptidase M14 domain-containing protein n=1 Tax=Patiria miniata TaxID=46514 RepID=A0A914A937_PATMI|nr:carboxypeptidase B-like [Patiria miniata]
MGLFRGAVLVALLGVCLARVDYNGFKVFRVTPRDDDEVRSMGSLRDLLDGKLDFWAEPRHAGKPIDFMVGPNFQDEALRMLSERGLQAEVFIDNVEQLIDEQMQRSEVSASATFDYDVYHTYDEINQWVSDIASQYSSIVTEELLGYSYEGREIKLLKLGKRGLNKPIVWLESGVHSREWLSPATMLTMVNMFLEGYGSDSSITTLLDQVDWYILPMFNPDGYVYTWTGDRMWRKTRKPNAMSACVGTDPNRNWDHQWCVAGASRWPCSDTYCGTAAHTEIEVKTVTDYILTLKNVQAFVDFHCYSQYWMVPWGYTRRLPANYAAQKALADKAVAALSAVYGTQYTTGSIANVIYEASGSSADWAYGVAGIPYSFAPELRDTGAYGFLMPERFIHASAVETFEAVKAIGNNFI